jgi:hypothetical protein
MEEETPMIDRRMLPWSLCVFLGLVAAPLSAQTPPEPSAAPPADSIAAPETPAPVTPAPPTPAPAVMPATMLRGGPMGELLSVYAPRSDSEIQRQLDNARDHQRSTAAELDGSRRLATEADARVKILKEEIETTEARRSAAKKLKDAAAEAEYTATAKRQNDERRYLENLRDAVRAETDRLESEGEAAKARAEALEREQDVARMHARIASAEATPADIEAYRKQLQKMLESYRRSADHSKNAAEARKKLAQRRLKQLESLSKLSP